MNSKVGGAGGGYSVGGALMVHYGTCTYGSYSDHTHVHTPATCVQDSKLSLQVVGFHDPSSLGGLASYPGFPLFAAV